MGAVAASLSFGGTTGVGVAIGAAVAKNRIGFDESDAADAAEVQAYVDDCSIDTSGALTQDAIATQIISAIVLAGSAAMAGGGTTGVAASGAGVRAENKIKTLVKAYIDGDGSDGIEANEKATITATSVAASIAASFGTVGVSLSGAGAHALNVILTDTNAAIENPIDPHVDVEGSVAVTAQDTSTINSDVGAASISATVGWFNAGTISTAASQASNTINNQVHAYLASLTVAAGTAATDHLTVRAIETASINSHAQASALAAGASLFGGVTLAEGMAHATGTVLTSAKAFVDQSTASAGGDLNVQALSTTKADVDVGTSAISSGIAKGGSLATATVTSTVEAYIGAGSDIDATGGNVLVEAISEGDADAAAFGVAGGILSVGVSLANAIVRPTLSAHVMGSGTTVHAAAESQSAPATTWTPTVPSRRVGRRQTPLPPPVRYSGSTPRTWLRSQRRRSKAMWRAGRR